MIIMALAAAVWAAPARAASSAVWTQYGAESFAEGDLNGVALTDKGALQLGLRSRQVFQTSEPYLWSLALDGTTLYAGSGNKAVVFRADASVCPCIMRTSSGFLCHALQPLAFRLFSGRVTRASAAEREASSRLSATISQIAAGAVNIRALRAGEEFRGRFDGALRDVMAAMRRQLMVGFMGAGLAEMIVGAVRFGAILGLGAAFVRSGSTSVGTVMAFFALIPFLGAFVVYLPAAIWLVIAGSYIKATILVVFGVAIVSQIDNFLKPLLISGRTQLHPLLLFFSILGGIQVFGFLGVVLGPVVAAVFVGVFDLYRHSLRTSRPQP